MIGNFGVLGTCTIPKTDLREPNREEIKMVKPDQVRKILSRGCRSCEPGDVEKSEV